MSTAYKISIQLPANCGFSASLGRSRLWYEATAFYQLTCKAHKDFHCRSMLKATEILSLSSLHHEPKWVFHKEILTQTQGNGLYSYSPSNIPWKMSLRSVKDISSLIQVSWKPSQLFPHFFPFFKNNFFSPSTCYMLIPLHLLTSAF